jgi:hypothetical protein
MILKHRNLWAIIFLVIFIVNSSLSILNHAPTDMLWFCNTVLLLFSIALFAKNKSLIGSVVISSVVIETIWTLDILSFLLTKHLFLGVASYFPDLPLFKKIITSYHILLLVVPILCLVEIKKIAKFSWLISSAYSLFILDLSLAFAAKTNINCAAAACNLGSLQFLYALKPGWLPFFLFAWLLTTLIFFLPIYLLFAYILKKLNSKHLNISTLRKNHGQKNN